MDIDKLLNLNDPKKLLEDVILWLICGTGLLLAGSFLREILSPHFPYIVHSPEVIRVTAFFLLLVLSFIFSKKLLKQIRIWFYSDKTYTFTAEDWARKWIFNGKTEVTNETSLHVKSSRAGCLLENHYWKDFQMSFELKNSPTEMGLQDLIGIIFRAEDLDNYFVLEVQISEQTWNKRKILPFVKALTRYKGGWDATRQEHKGNIPFVYSEFNKMSLKVKGDTAHLFLEGTLIFTWILPTHVDVNHVEAGVRESKREEIEKNAVGNTVSGHVQKIPFRLKPGLVGFRAHMNHGIIVRNLEIKPL